MMDNLTVNLENLSKEERTQLVALMEKANTIVEETPPMFPRQELRQVYYYIDDHSSRATSTEDGHRIDDERYRSGNYFLKEAHCEEVVKHLKDTLVFTRKAIEFADSYKFTKGQQNYYVVYNTAAEVWCSYLHMRTHSVHTTYMTKDNAFKFKDWLTLYKPEGI